MPFSKPGKSLGNREAVRRYREKKKAHTAVLEQEVKKLHLYNQQLVWKLHRQAILEAEVLRLRAVLFDLMGKIDSGFGSFVYQKVDCEMHCGNHEVDAKAVVSWQGNCQPGIVDFCGMRNRMEEVGFDHHVEASETLGSV